MKRITPPKDCRAMLVGHGKEWFCGDCGDLTWPSNQPQPTNTTAACIAAATTNAAPQMPAGSGALNQSAVAAPFAELERLRKERTDLLNLLATACWALGPIKDTAERARVQRDIRAMHKHLTGA